MTTIVEFMTADHRACDELLAAVEEAVGAGKWPDASSGWRKFDVTMRCHLAREEEILFPAFEEATGQAGGPTAVMRMEHEQMRALFGQLEVAVTSEDADRFLGLSDTLMVLIQQHNMKEEQILYPMSDQALPNAAAVVESLSSRAPDAS